MNTQATNRWAWLLIVAGCGGDQADDHHPEHAQDAADAAVQPSADAAAFQGCIEEDVPAFALGMSTVSPDGSIRALLQDASDVPPVRFLNDWTVAFSDAQGAPLTDVSLHRARAFMRVHGHYGTPDPTVTQHADEPAVFDLEALNLFMRGPWEVQLAVSSASAGEAELVFKVCVEE